MLDELTDMTRFFLTECTYGDEWYEITKLPDRYAWLGTLMRIEGNIISKELCEHHLAISTSDGRALVNMSRLPELKAILDRERN